MFSLLLVTLLVLPKSTGATNIINVSDPNGVLNGSPTYNSSNDEIVIWFNSGHVKRVTYELYSDSGLSDFIEDNDVSAPSGTYTGLGLTCVGYYDMDGYDSSNNHLFSLVIQVESSDLQSSECGGGSSGGGGSPDFSKVIDAINNNGGSLGDKLEGIGQKIDTGNNLIGQIRDSLQTDKSYGIKPIKSTVGLLDKNKPPEQTPFRDDKVYFKDEGSAEKPGKLPATPEIEDWDGVKREDDLQKDKEKTQDQYKQDNELSKDEFTQDTEKSKDGELSKDEFSQDGELSQDQFTQDTENKIDGELSQDQFTQDGELSRDEYKQDIEMSLDVEMPKDTFDQTYDFSNDNQYKQTHWYNQTNQF